MKQFLNLTADITKPGLKGTQTTMGDQTQATTESVMTQTNQIRSLSSKKVKLLMSLTKIQKMKQKKEKILQKTDYRK